ncbi:MAG: oxidoreductase [Candidatus Binatia bacterium]|nr:MAG: oxidoreductase [Candidatus Binatia bacterium]
MNLTDPKERCFWLARYGPYRATAPLREEIDADFAVVGGGFTGLSTAYHLKKAEPSAKVVVLEARYVGFGASGRNAGFVMTLFGFEPSTTKLLFGVERTVEAHRYMERAVDEVDRLVREHAMDSDYWFPGFLRVATTPAYADRIQKAIRLLTDHGIRGIEWLDGMAVREQVDSPLFLGAWWEPRAGLLDPAKHVRELKRVAVSTGVEVYENSPVVHLLREPERFVLRTPSGAVRARKLALATNAYARFFPELWLRQVPVFTHIVLTEPLDSERREVLGWQNRQGIEDARNLVHYFRLTPDDRLLMGGADVTVPFGRRMDLDDNPAVYARLEADVVRFFPALRGIRFTHRWGGPVSVTTQMVPALGYLGDRRAVYSLGCMGHGVSLSHLNGRTLADLLCERQSDLTEVWFVDRKVIPWPPEPIRFALGQLVRGLMKAQDRWYERDLEP